MFNFSKRSDDFILYITNSFIHIISYLVIVATALTIYNYTMYLYIPRLVLLVLYANSFYPTALCYLYEIL